jgi:uncharacterized UPF0160 family protein
MLKMLPAFHDAAIIRSRDPAVLALCDIVVDVGGEYIAESSRFDHHQKGFTGTLEGYATKLSSAVGLLSQRQRLSVSSLEGHNPHFCPVAGPRLQALWA